MDTAKRTKYRYAFRGKHYRAFWQAQSTEGSYVFRLTVIDDEGETAFDEVTVVVNPATVLTEDPVVEAGSDQELTLPDDSVTLSGSGSDPDGGDVSFQWTQQSGQNTATLSGKTLQSFWQAQSREAAMFLGLTVTDDEDETAFDEVTVLVNTASDVPEGPELQKHRNYPRAPKIPKSV